MSWFAFGDDSFGEEDLGEADFGDEGFPFLVGFFFIEQNMPHCRAEVNKGAVFELFSRP
jgi:hypothetical protein